MFRGSRPIFIDDVGLLWIAGDLGLVDPRSASTELHINTPVVGVTRTSGNERPFSVRDPRDLETIVAVLRDDGQLSGLRPDNDWDRRYVWEEVEAFPFSLSLGSDANQTEEAMHSWLVGRNEHNSSDHPVLLLEEDYGHSASQATMLLSHLGTRSGGGRLHPFLERGVELSSTAAVLDWLHSIGAAFGRDRRVVTLYQVVRTAQFPSATPLRLQLAYALFIAEI